MILASTIGQIGHPFYVLFAWILAIAYRVVPNYAVAIAFLTIVVMIVVFPITLRGTRGMMKMQLLAPEMKRLQAKYKVSPGMTVGERQELRQRQQEEMMALYKENNVSPTGGCLPMLLQMPIFIILYGTIRGLIHTVNGHPDPLYLNHNTELYKAIIHANGQLISFGINLAYSVRSPQLDFVQRIPFIMLILVAIALQYIQMKQLSGRNPQAAAANPQMQQMQKVMPVLFAVIYISIPAGVNIYFIVSSLFRIGQQEFMYRRDPHIQAAMSRLRAQAPARPIDVKGTPAQGRPKGVLGRLTQVAGLNAASNDEQPPPPPPRSYTPPRSAQSTANGTKGGAGQSKAPPPTRPQSRAQGKRPRRER